MAFRNASSNSTRLPTPPRDDQDHFDVHKAVDDALEYLEASLSSPVEQDSQQAGDVEPSRPTTPPPSSPLPNKSTSSIQTDERPKILRFSAETSFCESTAKPLLPSRLQHPTKSILKPFELHPSSSPTPAQLVSPESSDISTMLEFALKALAGQDILSKRDAWSSLWTSLKAHQDFPSHESLRNSLPMLESFLRRDIAQPSKIHEPSERQLKLQSLQFAYLLLWKFPIIQDSNNSIGVSNDFAAFLIDSSIESIGSDSISKDLLRNYLAVLSAPEIHGQIFTADRSTKCVKALDCLPERLTGKSVCQLRISILAQITSNHPNIAVETFDQIFPHLMSGLCSDFTPTRSRAIESALTIAISVGQRSQVAQTVREWLQRQDSENISYFTRFEQTLQGLLSTPDRHTSQGEAHHAPQIWGILNMLVRGDQMFLFHCLMRSSWTKIVATCFNATDSGLNMHAWTAWNRTIFAAQRLLLMRTRLLKKLCYPMFCCLQRANHDEERLKAKRQVHQSLRLILYYTYTHPLSADWMKSVWDIVIEGFCRHIRKDEVDDLFRFAQTLCSLFSDSTVKFRNAQRALFVDKEPLESTEVPKLSPSWIRSNIDLILSTLGPLLSQQNPPQHYVLFVKPVWTSLMKAIAQAGEKEIKASEALRSAIAHTLNSLRNFWSVAKDHHNEHANTTSMPATTLTALLKISVDIIGPLHWGEDVLVQTSDGLWEAANSPTKQAHANLTARRLRSPIASVFSLLSAPPSDVKPTPVFRTDVSKILQSCMLLRPSVSSKLDLLISCCKALPLTISLEQRQTVPILWQCLVEQTLSDIVSVTDTECRKILRLLSFGLNLPDQKSFEVGRAVFNKLTTLYRRDHQDRVFVTSIAQPWMEFLLKDRNCKGNTFLKYQALLIESYPPITHHTGFVIDRDLRHWNNTLFQHDNIKWPEMLYTMIGATLTECYSNPASFDLVAIYDFLSTVRDFLGQVDRNWLATVWDGLYPLHHFHSGLLLWIRDNSKLALRFEDRGYNLTEPIKAILQSMFKLLVTRVPADHSRLPVEFEALFLGAFQSHSKGIANVAIVAWNAMSDQCGSIEYSQELASTLERLTEFTEVNIPSTHRITERENMDIDSPSQVSDIFPWTKDARNEYDVTPLRRHKTTRAQTYSSPLNRLRGFVNSSPSKGSTNYRSPTPTKPHPRLRHDDSQVQFLPIVSSPLNVSEVESQYLTEHQKDVRSRQFEDAAMFPDLGSSPTPSRSKNLSNKLSPDENTSAALRSPASDSEQKEEQSDSQHQAGTENPSQQEGRPRSTNWQVGHLDESAKYEPSELEAQSDFKKAEEKEDLMVQDKESERSLSGTDVFVDASADMGAQENREGQNGNASQGDNEELKVPRSAGGPLKVISPNTSHVRSTHGSDIDKGSTSTDLVERIEDSFLPNKSSSSAQAISCSKSSGSDQSSKDNSDPSLLQVSTQSRELDQGSSPLAAKSIQSHCLGRIREGAIHEDSQTSEKDINADISDEVNLSQANSQADSGSSSQEMPATSLLFPTRRSERRRTSTPNYSVTRRKVKRQTSSSFEQASFSPKTPLDKDEDASDEIIAVEPPDADSPSLRTVLQQLGIIGADGRVASARSTPSGSQRELSKRKRSDSAESSRIRQANSQESELTAKRRRMGEMAPSSQIEQVRDSEDDLVSAPVVSERNADADIPTVKTEGAMSVLSRLKGLIGDVRGLQFGSGDDDDAATKEELVDLGKQLQAEIKAVTGM